MTDLATFKDHFSVSAAGYAAHRPNYPEALFDWLAQQVSNHNVAWDCATGSGQAARGLTCHFDQVIATDASAAQIANAQAVDRVDFRVAQAEASGLPDGFCDLVTVAQAAHWFDLPRFYAEVRRVLKPGGLLALWGYEHLVLPPELSAEINRFYHEVLAGYWPPERHHVETGYRELPFPFDELGTPDIAMTATWNLDQLLGYLATWSAVKNYRQTLGVDPIPALRERLLSAWGSPDTRKNIQWPLFMRLGRWVPDAS